MDNASIIWIIYCSVPLLITSVDVLALSSCRVNTLRLWRVETILAFRFKIGLQHFFVTCLVLYNALRVFISVRLLIFWLWVKKYKGKWNRIKKMYDSLLILQGMVIKQQQVKYISDFNISACTASKIIYQGNGTNGIFHALENRKIKLYNMY